MNPPYGLALRPWVKKAWDSSARDDGATVVCLLPVRADTVWWHDIVLPMPPRYATSGAGSNSAA